MGMEVIGRKMSFINKMYIVWVAEWLKVASMSGYCVSLVGRVTLGEEVETG